MPLLILSLAVLVILFAPREYRSEAKLFLQVGRESVKLDPTATTGDTISMQSINRDNEIVTAMEAIKSRGTIEKSSTDLALTSYSVAADVGRANQMPSPNRYGR